MHNQFFFQLFLLEFVQISENATTLYIVVMDMCTHQSTGTSNTIPITRLQEQQFFQPMYLCTCTVPMLPMRVVEMLNASMQ